MTHRARTFRTVAGDEIRVEISRAEGHGPRVYLQVVDARRRCASLELRRRDVQAIGAFLGEDVDDWAGGW